MNGHTDWADAKLLTWHETDYISDIGYTEDWISVCLALLFVTLNSKMYLSFHTM
jgi:hypothetical protein